MVDLRSITMESRVYLRYRLHVIPFPKQAPAEGWTLRKVVGYGKSCPCQSMPVTFEGHGSISL